MPNLHDFIQQFREIQPKFSRLYTRMLAQASLTQPQYAVLLELVHASPKPMTMTAISCKLYISKPAVTNLVDRLEKHHFLKRVDHPHDRRISLLQILPSGKKAVEKIQVRILELMTDAAGQFSPSERNTVQKFYSILSKSLDQVLQCPKEGAL